MSLKATGVVSRLPGRTCWPRIGAIGPGMGFSPVSHCHAPSRSPTFSGVIWSSGENLVPPASRPYAGQSPAPWEGASGDVQAPAPCRQYENLKQAGVDQGQLRLRYGSRHCSECDHTCTNRASSRDGSTDRTGEPHVNAV